MVNKMIYIDELILLNFIIDYVILSTLTFLLKKNVKKRRIFLSCLVGQLSILYLFVSSLLTVLFLLMFSVENLLLEIEYYIHLNVLYSNFLYD